MCFLSVHSRTNLLINIRTCATVARSGLYDCPFNRHFKNALDQPAEWQYQSASRSWRRLRKDEMESSLSAESTASSGSERKHYRVILLGGLIAGTLDITAAFVNSALHHGRGPIGILQGIASALLGPDSYNGGLATAALGLGLHFLIATVACAVFYVASRKIKFLVQQAIVSGLLYGVAVYLFMYHVVLPLAFSRRFPYTFAQVLTAVIIHMLFVGLPISLTVRGWRSKSEKNDRSHPDL